MWVQLPPPAPLLTAGIYWFDGWVAVYWTPVMSQALAWRSGASTNENALLTAGRNRVVPPGHPNGADPLKAALTATAAGAIPVQPAGRVDISCGAGRRSSIAHTGTVGGIPGPKAAMRR